MSDWDPTLYRRFERERTRPAADLLAAVEDLAPATIVDLGCGPGNSTALLAERFPDAAVTGIDTSPAMLAQARERLPGCAFTRGDIARWAPAEPVDLIVANASLQWVPDHRELLPRLLGALVPGGVLAVQMPDNRDEPSHAAMRAVAAEPDLGGAVGAAATARVTILTLEDYYDLLAPHAEVALWRTVYQHPMADAAAIVSWVRATGLRPFLDALPDDRHPAFLARYQARIAEAYPTRADGRRLLAFPRLFVVARKRA